MVKLLDTNIMIFTGNHKIVDQLQAKCSALDSPF